MAEPGDSEKEEPRVKPGGGEVVGDHRFCRVL